MKREYGKSEDEEDRLFLSPKGKKPKVVKPACHTVIKVRDFEDHAAESRKEYGKRPYNEAHLAAIIKVCLGKGCSISGEKNLVPLANMMCFHFYFSTGNTWISGEVEN